MKVSLSWLKRYVDINVPVEELCDRMTLAGFEIEECIDLSATMRNVVVGKVTAMEKHPDSDHLWICQIDIGGEIVQIVTGAQNVFVGALVPAALHDSHLPNGMHIKNGKLRGVPSNGMLCSGEELMLTEADYPGASVYGIMILKEGETVGADMRDVLGLNDWIIDFKITANRPDCQCALGVAKEVAVVLGTRFCEPATDYKTAGEDINDYIKVSVKDFDLCPRYYGRVVKNVRIAESPDWLKRCVTAAGMRPINNIVDITNFVMLETGQPMHAFDYRDIKNSEIIVRRAAEGEMITTLDEKEHTLTSEMLVIADGENPSCLAGIMGGLNSEIKEDTATIFFEAAKFRRDNVRKTGRALGMRTESSARFERGVDINNVEYAMNRALSLICELDCGDIVDGIIDLNEGLPAPKILTVKAADICALVGVEVPTEKIVEILNSLHLATTETDGVLTVSVPSIRDDVEGKADLAEEVMRIYGYDHIIGKPMNSVIMRGKKLPERLNADKIKSLLVGKGLYEAVTYSFIGSKAIDTLGIAPDDARRNAVTLLNPLGDEYSVMRTQLVTSMLTVLATNYNRKQSAAAMFEVSKVFVPKSLPVTEQPLEIPEMSIGLYGNGADFFTLKGLVEDVLELFCDGVSYERANESYYHPGRSAVAVKDGKVLALFGEIHPAVAEKYGLDTKTYVAEIKLGTLYEFSRGPIIFAPLPKFPAIERDFAMLCDASLPVAVLEAAIRQGAGKLLEKVELFDVYMGEQIEKGKKSVAYRVTLRSKEATLTDEDSAKISKKIVNRLESVGAVLRG